MPIVWREPLEPIKLPNIKDYPYTDEEVLELAECAIDPLYYMRHYMRIQHAMKGAVPFHPFPYQERMITSFTEFRFCIALTARQMGKTTCAAGYLLWKAMFNRDTTILIVANQMSGALEIMSRIRYAYEMTPDFLRPGVKEYNKGSITFDNGSKIVSRATTPDASRGLSISLLYCDEFAFGRSAQLVKDFWTSVRPTLATGGHCIITSTPKSDADQFSAIWRDAVDQTDAYGNPTFSGVGKNDFHPIKVLWDQHPERDAEFERVERAALGDARFRQEHCCEFVSDDQTLIDSVLLSQMRGSMPEFLVGPEVGPVRFYKDIEPNKTYLVGLDPSFGTGGNPAAIQVFELTPHRREGMVQVAEWGHNKTLLLDQVALLKEILHYIDDELRSFSTQRGEPQIYWTIENNNMGAASVTVVSHTGEEKFPGLYISEKRKKGQKRALKGMTTTASTKKAACVRFKSLTETYRLKINSEQLIRELKMFVTNANSAAAKPGETDDLISATLLCVRMLEQVTAWDDSFYELHETISDEEDEGAGPAAFVM